MVWAKSQPSVRYNLARSGVPKLSLRDLPIDLSEVDINGPNSYGFEKLLHQIAQRYGVASNRIVLTQGTSFANYLAYAGILRPGDEVIVEDPTYQVLAQLPELFGAKTVTLPRRFENNYQIDLAELRKKCSSRTRLIVLTNLHNPSGVLLRQDVLREIGQIAARQRAWVLVDEVYLETLYQRRPPAATSLGDNFISTCSLTKGYGLDGLRCGWLICHEKLADQLRKLNDFMGVVGVFISENLSALLFPHLSAIGARHEMILKQNFTALLELLDSHPEWRCVLPDGPMIAFPRHQGIHDIEPFVGRLRDEHETLIVPGKFFGQSAHFRIACGIEPIDFSAALDRLSRILY